MYNELILLYKAAYRIVPENINNWKALSRKAKSRLLDISKCLQAGTPVPSMPMTGSMIGRGPSSFAPDKMPNPNFPVSPNKSLFSSPSNPSLPQYNLGGPSFTSVPSNPSFQMGSQDRPNSGYNGFGEPTNFYNVAHSEIPMHPDDSHPGLRRSRSANRDNSPSQTQFEDVPLPGGSGDKWGNHSNFPGNGDPQMGMQSNFANGGHQMGVQSNYNSNGGPQMGMQSNFGSGGHQMGVQSNYNGTGGHQMGVQSNYNGNGCPQMGMQSNFANGGHQMGMQNDYNGTGGHQMGMQIDLKNGDHQMSNFGGNGMPSYGENRQQFGMGGNGQPIAAMNYMQDFSGQTAAVQSGPKNRQTGVGMAREVEK